MTDTYDAASESSGAQVAPPGGGTVEMAVFPKRPARTVDLDKSAPLGWWPAVVVALVAFVDRVEINLISGALPAIQDHFGFSDTAGGAIPTAASIAAALLLLPAGRLADRVPRVATIAIVVLVWSICSVLSGLATTFVMFFAVRVLIGAAGQLYNPPASSLLADYFPARSRGKAYGFERAGYYMGLPAGVILGGAVAEALGWRAVFFVAAVPGLLIAALVLTVKEPLRGLGDRLGSLRSGTAEPAGAHTPRNAGGAPLLAEARGLLRVRTLKGIIIGQALLSLAVAGLFYWLPTFLERTEDLGYDSASGLAGGVGGTGIVIGIVIGSRMGDRFHGIRHGWRIKVATGFLFLGAIALSGAVLLPGLWLRITLVAVACAGFAAAIPNLTAASADVVPADRRGLGFALLTFLVTLGGALGPFLIGLTSDIVGSTGYDGEPLALAMLVLVPAMFLAVLALLWIRNAFEHDAAQATGTLD
ncbi:Sugar phosphate permease [Thermomonospora echinospora]|uniref:Sugar phosphate permease n=1 Tax=Thermomonospora echinospora TaxID=1992 RepID=A0A1H6CZA4_9ACTN|nr:MFS transporter [Thermomonospora echinospora]SEG78088.1 Sugar phosphate permease [Thermomonospora echinospora]